VSASHCAFLAVGAEAQISVTRYGWLNPWLALRRDGEGRLEPVFDGRLTQRSQDLPELLCPTGAIWWAEALSHGTNQIVGTERERVLAGVERVFAGNWPAGVLPPLWDGCAGRRIVDVIENFLARRAA
jgi:hypothetical protein